MKSTRIAVALLLGIMLVPLLAFAVPLLMPPAADAVEVWPCAYTGYAFVSEMPVPAGTGIRVLQDSTVLGVTATGVGVLDDNQYYLDGVMAEVPSEVHFAIWDAGAGDWAFAGETAIHMMYGVVEVDLHAPFRPQLHIDACPYLFVHPGPDCDLPEALTNIGPPSAEYPEALNLVVTVWGVEGGDWMSYDAATGSGFLGPYGLDASQAYVMTHEDGVCNGWETCE